MIVFEIITATVVVNGGGNSDGGVVTVEIITATIVVSGGGVDGGVVIVEIITATIVVSGVVTVAGLRDRVLKLREASKQGGKGGNDVLKGQDFIGLC